MMRPSSRGYVIVGCVLGALLVAMLARPMLAVRRIGLDGKSLVRTGHCSLTEWVWREVVCNQLPIDPTSPSYGASLQLAAWTRQLTRASRMWSTADSAAWHARIDSVRKEMRIAHYARVDCDPSETGFTIGEAWRAAGDEIRLYGGPTSGPGRPATRWYVDVLLVPHEVVGCGLPPRHELHFKRAHRLFEEWVASQLNLSPR
jgi:hypothetical protein